MSVDQIKKNIFILTVAGLILISGCQPKQAKAPGPSPRPTALAMAQDDPRLDPPLPLKQPETGPMPVLQVIASMRSLDQTGHRRLQLYLEHKLPVDQAFYWQLVELYRGQYDVIWIYLRPPGERAERWQTQAAWFSPEMPQNLHIPGFKPVAQHDGLYWTS